MRISRNRNRRSAGYSAFGRTDGDRPIPVNFRFELNSELTRVMQDNPATKSTSRAHVKVTPNREPTSTRPGLL
jgi:hypothetical protein